MVWTRWCCCTGMKGEKLEKAFQVCDGRIASPAPERPRENLGRHRNRMDVRLMSQQPSHQSSCGR